MIKWTVFAVVLLGLVAVLIVSRKHNMRQHFFWRNVLIMWLLVFATVLTALLPLGVGTKTNNVSNLDILFVVDITPSANAVDGRGSGEVTRLQNMREDMHTISKDNIGASIGIMTFADQVNTYLPLATGANDIDSAVDTIYTATQFQTIQKVTPYTKVFEQVGDYIAKQQSADPTRQRVVIFMSDFEVYNNQEQPDQVVKSAAALRAHGAGYAGLLYGQEAGAKMLYMSYDYESGQYTPSYKSDYYSGEESGKYLQNNYKTVTSVPGVNLATQLSKSMGTDLIRTHDTQAFQPVIQKAASLSGRTAAKSPQSQALNQNILYVGPAFLGLVWICIAEFMKPSWLRIFMPKQSRTDKGESS